MSRTVLGGIIGLCCRTGLSAVFSSCCVAALQACETSRVGPPSPIADPGLFWAIFQIRYSPKELFCVARVYAFLISWMVTGLVTVDGNGGRGVVLGCRCCLLVGVWMVPRWWDVPCWSLLWFARREGRSIFILVGSEISLAWDSSVTTLTASGLGWTGW